MLREGPKLPHWNYFLALESDLEHVSRFVEFTQANYDTYSLEMAHLLLAPCSEIDVVLKALCKKVKLEKKPRTIDSYREILHPKFPKLCDMNMRIPRYGLETEPWVNWKENRNPYWWNDYNKVKHERGEYFSRATLRNTINAVAGLFAVLLFFYKDEAESGRLVPPAKLLSPPEECIRGLKQTDFGTTSVYEL